MSRNLRKSRRFRARLWKPTLTQIISKVFRNRLPEIMANVTKANAILLRITREKP